MFTGIVHERGRVVAVEETPAGIRLLLQAPRTARGLAVGDSVSVSGCCLTAIEVSDGRVAFEAVPETLRRSALGALAEGAEVNLEPALRAGEPLGGHYVQGHIDDTGRVRAVEPGGEGVCLWIAAHAGVLRYCVEKGSITVDGVSLTIADLAEDAFAVALIPHTLAETTLSGLEPGDEVNLEVDVLAKYVERLLASLQG
jgi:riboflavin synthase